MTRDNWTCQRPQADGSICGRSLEETGARPQIGHIVPESLGGKTVDSNLRAECGDCNEGAGNGLGGTNPQIPNNRGRNWLTKAARGNGVFFSLEEAKRIFERTWESYPVHIGWDAAEREWRNAVIRIAETADVSLGEAAEEILGKVRLYAISDSAKHDGLRRGWRPPYLSTWLKNGQFRDDPRDWQAEPNEKDERRDVVRRLARRFAGKDGTVSQLRPEKEK